tara:strand:+ start:707 stop:1204 length:498 start_codon:yes stop_codon:yes gene_type:complete
MQLKIFKKIVLNFSVVFLIFIIDRLSKIYIVDIFETENISNVYINQYLNLYLIWNKGIAFGLLSIEKDLFYNFVTLIIICISLILLIMIIKSEGFQQFSLLLILGGSLGNLFDRIHHKGVPDFIDFHINEMHWFIFNVADIFITIGVICLIFIEIFLNKKLNEIN